MASSCSRSLEIIFTIDPILLYSQQLTCVKAASSHFLSGDTHATVSSVIPVFYNLANKILKEKENNSILTKNIQKRIIIYYMEKNLHIVK